jgi:hypothetical protein
MDITAYTARNPADMMKAARTAPIEPVRQLTARVGSDSQNPSANEDDSPTAASPNNGLFETVLDTVNPLQHIPGVSSIYQGLTGDTANPLSSIAGGFLFGGPIGMAAGAAGSFLEMLTGKSLAGHAMALFSGSGDTPDTPDGAVQTAMAATGDPLFAATQGNGVQQYQEFAQAAATGHEGIGASSSDIALSQNIWTQQALKQATEQYENSQHLGGGAPDRMARII